MTENDDEPTGPTEEERTVAIAKMAIANIAAERDWWAGKYRILKRILEHHDFVIEEDEEGNLDMADLRARGYLAPKPAKPWTPPKTEH